MNKKYIFLMVPVLLLASVVSHAATMSKETAELYERHKKETKHLLIECLEKDASDAEACIKIYHGRLSEFEAFAGI